MASISLVAILSAHNSSVAGDRRVLNEDLKLIASDGEPEDQFGRTVAVDGDLVIVGVRFDDDNGPNSGAAYVFNVVTGEQLFKFTASNGAAGEYFGMSVAIDGDRAIVGADRTEDNGPDTGSIYVFDVTTGEELFELLASDGASHDHFGRRVSMSGNLAVVGAFGDDDNGETSGSVYVFDVTTGEEVIKLVPADGEAGDEFGDAVSLSGSLAIVGADGDDDNGSDSGAAYIFNVMTGEELFKLLASGGAAGDTFGESVAIDDGHAVVGAPSSGDAGAAYIFDIATGEQLFKLLASDGAGGDNFGQQVSIHGSLVIVGAHGDDDNGSASGSAYVFDVETGEELFKFLPSDGATDDHFGFGVAIDGNVAVVGVWGDDDNGIRSGSIYVFAGLPLPCDADISGNGSVGPGDLADLLAAWGPCADCPPDFNGDGVVNAQDLAFLLSLWGPCP